MHGTNSYACIFKKWLGLFRTILIKSRCPVISECYVIPAQGRCRESEKTNYWSYSPKINACAQIYGCYSFRDRNVFLTRPVCDQTCGVDGSSSLLTMPNNTRVSIGGCLGKKGSEFKLSCLAQRLIPASRFHNRRIC